MKTKSKIFIFICTFALIFSLVSVSCFAFTPSLSPITLAETVPFSSVGFEIEIEYHFFTSDQNWAGVYIYAFADDVEVAYIDYDGTYVDVYLSDSGGWLDNTYRTVILGISPYQYANAEQILYVFDYLIGDSPVANVSNSLSNALFGSSQLNSAQQFTIDMVSTLLVAALVLLPLLLSIGFLLRCFRL